MGAVFEISPKDAATWNSKGFGIFVDLNEFRGARRIVNLERIDTLIPGDGVTPLVKILRKLAEKGYDGALSVELFLPELQGGDPQEVATQIRTKCEKVMREANVL